MVLKILRNTEHLTYLKRKIIFQTFIVVFHVNFQGYKIHHLSLDFWRQIWSKTLEEKLEHIYHLERIDGDRHSHEFWLIIHGPVS